MLEQNLPSMLNDTWVEKTETEEAFYYKWEDIKWYTGYSDIDNLMEWLNDIEDIEEESPNIDPKTGKKYSWNQTQWGFIRLGEKDDDIETHGDPYHFSVQVYRHIEYPGNTE